MAKEDKDAISQAVAVGVLQSQMSDGQAETNRRLERIERKIDDQNSVPHATFEAFKKEVADTYVTKVEFSPTQKIVYGLVTLALVAVAGSIISLVVRQ